MQQSTCRLVVCTSTSMLCWTAPACMRSLGREAITLSWLSNRFATRKHYLLTIAAAPRLPPPPCPQNAGPTDCEVATLQLDDPIPFDDTLAWDHLAPLPLPQPPFPLHPPCPPPPPFPRPPLDKAPGQLRPALHCCQLCPVTQLMRTSYCFYYCCMLTTL